MNIDKDIYLKCQELDYSLYFLPEMKLIDPSFKPIQKININDDFYTNRKIGENENYICKLIREDSVKEFISYVDQNDISLNSLIPTSIFETNQFLIKKQLQSKSNSKHERRPNFKAHPQIMPSIFYNTTLIEYSAFYGSIQIFNYLRLNDIQLTSSLWLYSIHGGNAEIIHLLEDNHIEPENPTFNECYMESIKCHHIDLSNYMK